MIGPDGSLYMEVESSQYVVTAQNQFCAQGESSTYSEQLQLLKLTPGASGPQFTTLNSYSNSSSPAVSESALPYNIAGDVIPDGNGGALASYEDVPYPSMYTSVQVTTDTTSGASQTFANLGGITSDGALVLGDNNTAFVTDGTNVVSFNPTNLQQNWAYTSTSGGTLTFVAATSGAGVTLNDSQLGVIQLDGSGNAGTPTASLQGANPYEMWAPESSSLNPSLGLWTNISTTPNVALSFMVGVADPLAASIYAESPGGPEHQRSAIPVPTYIRYDLGPITELNGNAFVCGGAVAVDLGNEGYAYCATATVRDKKDHVINNQQFRIWETIQPVPGNNPPSGSLATSQGIGVPPFLNGTFRDAVDFYLPEAVGHPPQPGQFFKAKQFLTITNKLKSYNNLRINCQNLQWNSGTVIDVTRTPYASCQ